MKKHVSVCLILLIITFGLCTAQDETTALNIEVISPVPPKRDQINMTLLDTANQTTTAVSTEAFSHLKPGLYSVQNWALERTDDNGDTWQLKAARAKGQISIIQGQKPNLKLGEPITAALIVGKSSKGYRFDAEIKTPLDEDVQIELYGKRIPPELRIHNESGTYDERFTFSYG